MSDKISPSSGKTTRFPDPPGTRAAVAGAKPATLVSPSHSSPGPRIPEYCAHYHRTAAGLGPAAGIR
ncbi:hypothetical protein MASSI9I_20562 [Massilia sp. 9I]|nr:hypothetical protein MASSI9I_20562 [Massilia sp. 9I]